jgi:hypothetical protein
MKKALIILVFIALALAVRLPFTGEYPDGWDGADFILGIQKFDVAHQRPHFPGYPVYMGAAKVFKATGFSYHLSALLPGLLVQGGVLALIFFATSGLALVPRLLLFLLAVCHPMIGLFSLKAGTETLGGGLMVLSALYFPAFYAPQPGEEPRGSYFLSGIAAGLLLGIRLSYFPFILSLFLLFIYFRRDWADVLEFVSGWLLALAIWLVPLRVISGRGFILVTGSKFVFGHFFNWGNTVFTHADLWTRIKLFAWGIITHVFSGPWSDLSWIRFITGALTAGLALIGFYRLRPKAPLLILVLPYLAWVFFFQNPNHPRHLYPFIFALVFCVWKAFNVLGKRPAYAAFGLLVLLWAGICVNLCVRYKRSVPPQVQLVKHVQEKYPGVRAVLFCNESFRMFDLYYPITPRVKTGSTEKMLLWLKKRKQRALTVLFTSEVGPRETLKEKKYSREAVFSRSKYLSAESPVLKLYRYLP